MIETDRQSAWAGSWWSSDMGDVVHGSASGWRETTFGDVLTHRRERGHDDDPLLSVTADRGVILHAEAGRRDISNADKSAYWRVFPDDIAYNSMRMWQGVSGHSKYFGIVSPAYTVCTPTASCDSSFLAHLLKHPRSIAAFRNRSQGLVSDTWNLKYRLFSAIWTRIPNSRVEQQRIAEILNTVDETIRNTELLIAKLKQVKQGLLQDLLTRGIGDNIGLRAPTPQSEPVRNGAIGRIPTSWKVVPLAEVLDGIEAGKSPDCPDRPAASGEWGVLKVSAIKAEGFDQRENKVLPNRSLVDPRFEVQHGDLLMSRANTYELVGLACLVEGHPDRLLLCDKTLRLRTVASVNRKFVLHALETVHARRQIQVHATGTSGSMKNISQAAIAGVLIPLPPRDEQDRIVSILAAVGSRVDAERACREKLRLLKMGLMEDLLTGRVHVTEVLQGAAT